MTNEQAEARAQRLPEVDRRLFESFRRLGMSADAALSATTGRDRLPSTDPAETMVESFEAGFLQQGRTPEQARRMGEAATAGRQGGTLREVREGLATDRPDRPGRTPLPVAVVSPADARAVWRLRLYRERSDELLKRMSVREALQQAEREAVAVVALVGQLQADGADVDEAIRRAKQEVMR